MKDRKLATRYARALLAALGDPRRAEEADHFLDALRRALSESADLRRQLHDPALPRTARERLLRTLAERADMPVQVASFLATVVDHNRTTSLPSIALVFHEEREAAAGIVPAEITTVKPLDAELEARARRALERMTGRKVRLTAHVDPSLLGGAVTRVGSTVFDGSLKSQLSRMRRRLALE